MYVEQNRVKVQFSGDEKERDILHGKNFQRQEIKRDERGRAILIFIRSGNFGWYIYTE